MTTTSTLAGPPLPVEIFRIIIEIAAKDPHTALILTVVCRSFHEWTTPILYNTVSINLFRIRDLRRACHAGKLSYTRSLILGVPLERQHFHRLGDVLESCRNVTRLLLNAVNVPSFNVSMRPSQISIINSEPSSRVWRPSNIFEKVTHIYVEYGYQIDIEHWRTLKAVTHLGISAGGWYAMDVLCMALIRDLLSLPSIEILLVCCFDVRQLDREDWVELAKMLDERLIVRPMVPDHLGLFATGGSVWDDVDQFRNWRTLVKAPESYTAFQPHFFDAVA